MYFDFFIQHQEGSISIGDEIAVFAEPEDYVSSGRYVVATLGADQAGSIVANLVGMGVRAGSICEVVMDAHE